MKTTRWFVDERYQSYQESFRSLEILDLEHTLSLVKAAKNGDKRALHKLALHNWRLILIAAAHYLQPGLDLRDLMQDGYLQFLEIAPSYRHTEGPFPNYIIRGLRWRLPRGVSLRYRTCHAVLFSDLDTDEDRDIFEQGVTGLALPNADPIMIAASRLSDIRADLDHLHNKLRKFPEHHQAFVRYCYGTDLVTEPLSMRAIAAKYFLKSRTVSDLMYQTLRTLRDEGHPFTLDWIGSRVNEGRGIIEFLAAQT